MGCYHGTHESSTSGGEEQSRSSIAGDSLERTGCRDELRSCASGERRPSYRGKESRDGVELIDRNIVRTGIGNERKLACGIDRDALRLGPSGKGRAGHLRQSSGSLIDSVDRDVTRPCISDKGKLAGWVDGYLLRSSPGAEEIRDWRAEIGNDSKHAGAGIHGICREVARSGISHIGK